MTPSAKVPVVDVYWSFRSPYSYLASPRLLDMQNDWEMTVRVKVVMPLAVRSPDFFLKVNPLWPPYLLRDTMRIAENLQLPFGWPDPDPVVVGETLEATADQPYIHRLSRLGVLAEESGRGIQFVREVSGIIFGGVKQWDKGDHLAQAAERAGCDFAEMDRQEQAEAERLDKVIAANEAAQKEAGHWGVPLMVFEGEPFFGQDRLDLLFWRLQQKGLRSRI